MKLLIRDTANVSSKHKISYLENIDNHIIAVRKFIWTKRTIRYHLFYKDNFWWFNIDSDFITTSVTPIFSWSVVK